MANIDRTSSQQPSLGPVPARDMTDRMQFGIRPRAGVLLCDPCSELDMLAHGPPKRFIAGHSGFVQRLQVDLDEPLALFVGDLQVAVYVDDVPKAKLLCETRWAAERLGRKPGQMIDVSRYAVCEEVLEDRVGERLGVKELLEPMQALIAASMLIKGLVDVLVRVVHRPYDR